MSAHRRDKARAWAASMQHNWRACNRGRAVPRSARREQETGSV